MLTRLLLVILFFAGFIKSESSIDSINETREKIAQINLFFLENKFPDKSSVIELERLLGELKNRNYFSNSIIKEKDYKNKKVLLIESYKAFEKYFFSKSDVDTLKKSFRAVNNNFNSLFGDYFLNELKKSSKQKIILFSTSMSCECTYEICYQQEAGVQKLLKENPHLFDYAVVDTYSNYNLQNEYEVGFIPVVIVVNNEGKEIKRYVRSKNLYTELKLLFNNWK